MTSIALVLLRLIVTIQYLVRKYSHYWPSAGQKATFSGTVLVPAVKLIGPL